jgi:ABC-type antimicrobial peptide transport system permease subunit
MMTPQTLIRRSLRFHWRSHLGVVLGAAIGSAAFIGALVVGDSVKGSLIKQAFQRTTGVEFMLDSKDRFFRSDLADAFESAEIKQKRPLKSFSVLFMPGVTTKADSSARVNKVQIFGVNQAFWKIGRSTVVNDEIAPNQAWLNESLAAALKVEVGDEIILRIPKPSALSRDFAVTPKTDDGLVLRLKVQKVLSGDEFGDYSPINGVTSPNNIFVSQKELQALLGSNASANLILTRPIQVGRGDRPAFSLLEQDLANRIQLGWQLADTQSRLEVINKDSTTEIRTTRVFLDRPLAVAAMKAGTNSLPILTYLATLLRSGTNATPYSMVTAASAPWTPSDLRDDEILVSQWLADDLHVKPGDEIALSYYLPESGAKLEEATNTFRVHSIVPMELPWADRTLMPDFPGIEKAESTSEWDAGFPLTYEIRKKDDEYWKQHRGTPKAFITLAAGQRMWGNRFGNLTAIRFPIPTNLVSSTTALTPANIVAYKEALEKKILTNLNPEELGLRFEPVREQALKAAEESQDFGGLFLGFSVFLIAAALLLMAMLFRFGLEQRASEIGTLLALGFTAKQVRKFFLREGVVLAFIGGVIGVAGGICFAKAMIHGLNTSWNSAVGGTSLGFYMTGKTLCIGLLASVVVSMITMWLALRKFVKREPRELLAGEIGTEESLVSSFKFRVGGGAALLVAGTIVGIAMAKGETANAGAFFGAGALVLIAGLSFANAWLAKSAHGAHPSSLALLQRVDGVARPTLCTLALQGCARRRKRSLATIAMLACGSFLIVSIGVFRLDANRDATQKSSGTGGFAFIGETTMPVVHDLNSQSGRDFFALDEKDLAGVNVLPFRVRAGDEASCLNLNAALKPKLLGVKPEMLDGRFGFAKGDGWKALKSEIRNPKSEIEIPGIGDANSIQWAMKKNIGDTIDYVDERGQPFKVRIVGAVANSILQGQLIIDEAEFVKRFPAESGYRMFLVDAPSNTVSQVSATLSRAMQDVGLELTPTAARLNQFNAVQNTYLGTFQILGGLGLLLGSVGLGIVVLRNVLERRGELAVLMAVGFPKRQVQRLLLMENGALLLAGLALGMVAAAVAVLPALMSTSAELPVASLAITMIAVLANGVLWTWAATRFAVRGDLLNALRNE